MTSMRAGILAVRAVNDYRRRDVFGFLGVRYYLDSIAARTDAWAMQVAPSLIMTRQQPSYFNAQHFKEYTESSGIEHRSMFVPSPNECIAEAALLAECAKRVDAFGSPPCVYSYVLNDPRSRIGSFVPYAIGLRRRQDAIAKACEAVPDGIVRYMDIKKFYPNVALSLAHDAWRRHCKSTSIPMSFAKLGEQLIDGYSSSGNQAKPAILTGPMFSHLLANLVFREIDLRLSTTLNVAYCRYVDDITLVGARADVDRAHRIVRDTLEPMGLSLHDDGTPKNLELSCSKWLPSRDDFGSTPGSYTWVRLVGNLKRYLLQHPERTEVLRSAFIQQGFRLPVRDYSTAIREPDFAQRVLTLASLRWFRRRAQALTAEGIMNLALSLRRILYADFRSDMDGASTLVGYERKRRLSRLRYCLARLVYVATEDDLAIIADVASEIPELFFHAQVLKAVATRNIDRVLAMGTNASQATAQALRASGSDAVTTSVTFQKSKEQSLAVFLMNGVNVTCSELEYPPDSELIRFARSGADMQMMKDGDGVLREIACLHGLSIGAKHASVFEVAFDEDETLSMDAVTQLQQSVT